MPAYETVEQGGVSNHTEAALIHTLLSLLIKVLAHSQRPSTNMRAVQKEQQHKLSRRRTVLKWFMFVVNALQKGFTGPLTTVCI